MHTNDLTAWSHNHEFDQGNIAGERGTRIVMWITAIMMVVEMSLVLGSRTFGLSIVPAPLPHPAGYSNTRELGRLLYTDYVYPFELAAVVLLVAIVAAIALTMRRRKNTRYQDPAQQVKVKRSQRVRLVSMPAEKTSTPES